MQGLHSFLHYMVWSSPWYTGAYWSNQFQWTVVWLPTLYVIYKHHKCTCCWRIAKHPVKGTSFKTCHRHTTIEDHARLSIEHKKKYPKLHKFLKEQ
jgi:hypothetical protein